MVADLLAGNSPPGKHGIYFNQLHAIHIQKQKNKTEGKGSLEKWKLKVTPM